MVTEGISKNKNILLRHDVDISIKKAVEFAEFESSAGIGPSTYYILFSSPFYNPLSPDNVERIRMITDLGYNVGLHYDLSINNLTNEEKEIDLIMTYINLLKHISRNDVNTITFHKPAFGVAPNYSFLMQLEKKGLMCMEMQKQFHYISDSGNNWRENYHDVFDKYQYIQINTHPIWYTEKEKFWEDKLLDLDLECDKSIIKEIESVREYRKKVIK